MKIGSENFQTIWVDKSDASVVKVIDQQKLPFFFEIRELRTVDDVYNAIDDMTVRGAPLIGATAHSACILQHFEITSQTVIRSIWQMLHVIWYRAGLRQ